MYHLPLDSIQNLLNIVSLLLVIVGFIVLLLVVIIFHRKAQRRPNSQLPQNNYPRSHWQESPASIEADIRRNPQNYYILKGSCMTPNESRMYYYINQALDNLVKSPMKRSNYVVFPQVSLYALIKLRPDLLQKYQHIALSNYIAKSIDFVICHCEKQPYTPYAAKGKAYHYYAYVPILLIELDGQSHYSSDAYGHKAWQRQQQNDQFKNDVCRGLNLPLLRFPLTGNAIRAGDQLVIQQLLQDSLFPNYQTGAPSQCTQPSSAK